MESQGCGRLPGCRESVNVVTGDPEGSGSHQLDTGSGCRNMVWSDTGV